MVGAGNGHSRSIPKQNLQFVGAEYIPPVLLFPFNFSLSTFNLQYKIAKTIKQGCGDDGKNNIIY
jgi:hypothetical protein